MRVELQSRLTPTLEDDLFGTLRQAGYEPFRGRIVEERSVRLAFDLVVRIAEDVGKEVGKDAALVLLGALAQCAHHKLREFRGAGTVTVRVLYGPRGEIARTVTMPDKGDSE